MKRRLFTILSVLSLLLFVAVVGLWVRSYFVADHFARRWLEEGIGGAIDITFDSGSLRMYFVRVDSATHDPMGPDASRIYWTESPKGRWPGGLGFQFARNSFRSGASSFVTTDMAVPAWFAALVLTIIPAIKLAKVILAKRPGRRLCPSCGYDLRATPGRCPECGLVSAAPPP